MNSMKKLILLTCLAGSIGSAQAGIWQDFKNSCGSLLAACTKSLNDNASVISTKACNAYASCIDTTTKNAQAMASSVSNTASNVKDNTVKIATPVIQPMVSTAKTGANGISTAAQFTSENPKLVGSVALASIAAYLAHCRNATAHWLADIKEVQTIVNAISPNNNFKNWRVKAEAGKPAWNIADLMKNPERTYGALKIERGSIGESDNAFIAKMLGNRSKKGELQEEQDLLEAQAEKVKSVCLAHSNLLPSLRSHEYKKNNNFVTKLIQDRIDAMADSERYIDLSVEQMQFINQQINNKVAASYINPFKMARRWALPYEAAAIKQYWELYQSIQRIEALKDCVQKERERRNAQNDPHAARQAAALSQLSVVPAESVDNLL